MAVAAISSLGLTYYLGAINVGVAMALGALVSSPSDITGSFRRRNIGILISIFLAVFSTLVAGYAAQSVFFIPILGILTFSLAFISVYGFRASLISFSGLFAVVLSLAKVPSEETILMHALWIGLGGFWYLTLSLVLHFLNRGKQAEELLAEGFAVTADYLRIRAHLVTAAPDARTDMKRELSELQSAINEKHETIRELVISRRVKSGKSGEARRKMLVFMELVDILEISMANPVNYDRMDQLFQGHGETLEVFKEWSIAMADELQAMAVLLNGQEDFTGMDLEARREKAGAAIEAYREQVGMPKARKAILVLRNLYDFKERQQEKLRSILRLLKNRERIEDLGMKNREAMKFITSQEYSFKNLQDNLDFESPIFRHSLRLAVVMVAGYIIGSIFALQNTYWILLTSLVIMRPGYSLTRERSKQRLYGTLIGGAVATLIIFVTQNVIVLGVLAVITVVLAFAMLQRNYKASAAFITLNIIFIYSLISPNAFTVIQYRMLDTVIGAGLAFLGNSYLWPTWEYKGIQKFITQSIRANEAYLKEINDFYQRKSQLSASYKLARKKAFLAIGNLNSAFQRMTQEPKSKQRNLRQLYEIVTLNQEFLSSAASLGTFIASHSTTEASEHFRTYIVSIRENLNNTLQILEGHKVVEKVKLERLEEAERYFRELYDEMEKHRNLELEMGKKEISREMRSRFQEAQLVREQLKWLLQISDSLRRQAQEYINN